MVNPIIKLTQSLFTPPTSVVAEPILEGTAQSRLNSIFIGLSAPQVPHYPKIDDIRSAPLSNYAMFRLRTCEAIYKYFQNFEGHDCEYTNTAADPFDNLKIELKTIAQQLETRPNEYGMNQNLLLQTSRFVIGSNQGGRFGKDDNNLPFTLVRLANNEKIYLTNSMTQQVLDDFAEHMGCSIENSRGDIKKTKSQSQASEQAQAYHCTIGKGGEGKVRFAVCPNTTELKAVKKITDISHAQKEIANWQAIESKFLPKFYGSAIIKKSQTVQKAYIAFEFIPGMDGAQHIEQMHSQQMHSTDNTQSFHLNNLINQTALNYLQAVYSLHSQGYAHSDVKPDNFLHHQNGDIYITDLGMAHNTMNHSEGGTEGFYPPESFTNKAFQDTTNYNAMAHDAYSLGMTFMCLLYGSLKNTQPINQLTSSPQFINNSDTAKPLTIQIYNYCNRPGGSEKYTLGTQTQLTQPKTLTDITIRLLDADPHKRMTVPQALKVLPSLFFTLSDK